MAKKQTDPAAPADAGPAPAAADAGQAPAAPPVHVPASTAPVKATEETKKKKEQPGKPPRRGKKLRNQMKNIEQKLEKEGAVPLHRAIQLLKSIKRAKFDETVEVHM